MLAYAGKGRQFRQPTDLNRALQDFRPLLELTVARHATLHFELQPDLPPVLADDAQLRRVVMNLVANAAEALGDGPGDITLTTSLCIADDELLRRFGLEPDLLRRRYVSLAVRDTGCGMAPEIRARVFEPFFTTKFLGRGLGLAAVQGIVRTHKGALQVESAPGQGSCFTVLLPCADGEDERPEAAMHPLTTWHGSGTVLLIDSTPAARATLARMLEALGFRVIQATDGWDGLATFRAFPQVFRLVLLNVEPAGPGSAEMIAELRALRPDVPVLLLGAAPQPPCTAACLPRPCTLEDLVAALQPLVK